MEVIEPGQDRKVAALRSAFHVHIFLLSGGNMNKDYFDIAFIEAEKAFNKDEVPIGAVIVKDNAVIASAYNHKEEEKCCTAHAEILAIQDASKKLNNWRLEGCSMYVTLDPCPMCASAIKQARIEHVYSALNNSDSNNLNIIENIFKTDNVNPNVEFISNLDQDRSKELLNSFFEKQRN